MRLRNLFEAEGKTAVVAFGRLNPPTIGHQKLVNTILSKDGDPYLFLSQTQKAKTDPLDFDTKLAFAKSFFPNITVGHSEVRTPIQMLQKLQELGYSDVIYVAGSDRVEGFDKLFNQYNGVADKSGVVPYKFNSISVISAGDRDPDADGAEGMSASKMRSAALNNDFDSFKQGVPKQDLADKLFKSVQGAMGVDPSRMKEDEDAEDDEFDPRKVKADVMNHLVNMYNDAKKDGGYTSQKMRFALGNLLHDMDTAGYMDSDYSDIQGFFHKGIDIKADEKINMGMLKKAYAQAKNLPVDPVEEATQKKNCGCGKDPCETYGNKNEAYDPKHGHDSFGHVKKHKDDNDEKYWAVYNQDGKIVKTFYSEKNASKYAEKNHDALMKNKIKANEVLTTPDEVLDELIGFKKQQKVVQQQKPKIDVLNNIAMRTDNKPFPLSYNAGQGEISVGGKVYVGPSAAKKFVSFFDRNEDKQEAMLKALKSASTTAKLFDVLGLPYKLDMER